MYLYRKVIYVIWKKYLNVAIKNLNIRTYKISKITSYPPSQSKDKSRHWWPVVIFERHLCNQNITRAARLTSLLSLPCVKGWNLNSNCLIIDIKYENVNVCMKCYLLFSSRTYWFKKKCFVLKEIVGSTVVYIYQFINATKLKTACMCPLIRCVHCVRLVIKLSLSKDEWKVTIIQWEKK